MTDSDTPSRPDQLARERTRLARERTTLAHIRTGFASFLFGIAIVSLFPSVPSEVAGGLFVALGAGFVLSGGYSYLRSRRRTRSFVQREMEWIRNHGP